MALLRNALTTYYVKLLRTDLDVIDYGVWVRYAWSSLLEPSYVN
jgi:hypothetical protein